MKGGLLFLLLGLCAVALAQDDSDSYTKLFLGPGFPSPQPQIVDLTGESQSDCPEVAPYPLEGNSYNGVGTFVNGRGMVCGGYDGEAPSPASSNQCFSWDESASEWVEEAPMMGKRFNGAAARLSDEEWWVTGGFDYESGESLSSTELYLTSTGEFVPYVDLPLAMNSHNVMRVNDTHAALTQGSEDQGVFLLDRTTEEWTRLPDMPASRGQISFAGYAEHSDGRRGVVTAGGAGDASTDFLDLDTLVWEPRAFLPHDLMDGASVPYRESFLAAGGFSADQGGFQDLVFWYNPDSDEWEEQPGRMAVAAQLFPSFLVPDSYAGCE